MKYYQKKIECMPRSELKELQSKRLVSQVAYVYDNVPPYRAKMNSAGIKPCDIRSIDDIVHLPFTEKTDLRDAYPFGLFAMPQSKISRLQVSSGTTGKLTVAGYSKRDIDEWSEVMARSMVCAGTQPGSIVHVAYGYGLFTGGLGAHYGAERLGCTVVPVSSGNTARQIQLLQDFAAQTLCCTPSYALYIAEELAKRGTVCPGLKVGIFGAEPWTEEMRREIEKKLNITALDIYGLSEITGPGVAMECTEKNGMHVWEDHFYPEVLDKNLRPAGDGEQGELVFTTLTKQGMPLLRYRTRDICILNRAQCGCGRTHVRMSKILGRTDDMLIIRGINVFPSQIETVLLGFSGEISAFYQIFVNRVDNMDSLEISVEITQNAPVDTVKRIEQIKHGIERGLVEILGLHARVKIVEPNTIPRSEGKAVRIVDNRPR